MARGKKKEELSLEEKLKQALVPVGEQPYEVPGNWCWVYLTLGFCECKDAFRKPISAADRAKREGNVPYYGATGQVGWIDDYLTDEQLVLVGEDGAPFLDTVKDKAYMIDGKAWVNNHAHILKSYYGEVGNKFIMNYLNSFAYKGYVNGTTRLKLTQASMNTIPVPLPPLYEQQRIVEQIESLFAKLDEVRDKVQFVKNCSDKNFAAVVHEALSGNLTERWRMQNGISRSGWKKDKLGNLGRLERGRSKHRPRNDSKLFGGAYPFIQTGDVAEADVYIEKHKQTLSEFGLAQSRIFPKGTLCITIAANIGDVAILSYDCCFPDSVVGFTPYEDVESKYIYYMMSELQKEIEANAPATAQKNINLKILHDIDITIPSCIEQKKIIAILDDLFDKKKQVKEKAEQIIGVIDLMKKSILAKAFRG
ncbi:MAG: restriction endonuclease subunit S, partial [Clostridium sp.]|nr:restriction endonuclease subunit S [Clostridium sp.]